jgi:DNA-binding MarR family transcriptional regulator
MEQADRVHALIELAQRQFPKLDFSAKQVVGRILAIDNVFSRDFGRLLSSYSITPSEFGILNVLRCQGPPYTLAPSAINQLHFSVVTSGGMTNILHGLQNRGFIERLPDPADGRGVLIRLTPKALGMIDAVIEARVLLEHRWLIALDAKERASLETLLRKFLVSLEPYTASPAGSVSDAATRAPSGRAAKAGKSGGHRKAARRRP